MQEADGASRRRMMGAKRGFVVCKSKEEDDDRSTTTEAAAPEDLDPAAFLKSVRELSEKREREDNERYRRLEEEIEKGRSERLARRAGEWEMQLLRSLLEEHI